MNIKISRGFITCIWSGFSDQLPSSPVILVAWNVHREPWNRYNTISKHTQCSYIVYCKALNSWNKEIKVIWTDTSDFIQILAKTFLYDIWGLHDREYQKCSHLRCAIVMYVYYVISQNLIQIMALKYHTTKLSTKSI